MEIMQSNNIFAAGHVFEKKVTQYIMLHSIYYSVSRVVNIAVLVSLPIVSAMLMEYW